MKTLFIYTWQYKKLFCHDEECCSEMCWLKSDNIFFRETFRKGGAALMYESCTERWVSQFSDAELLYFLSSGRYISPGYKKEGLIESFSHSVQIQSVLQILNIHSQYIFVIICHDINTTDYHLMQKLIYIENISMIKLIFPVLLNVLHK